MICVCCGDKNVVENTMRTHFVEHGKIFECVEERMKCLDCGFSFVTNRQLRDNLERRVVRQSRRNGK